MNFLDDINQNSLNPLTATSTANHTQLQSLDVPSIDLIDQNHDEFNEFISEKVQHVTLDLNSSNLILETIKTVDETVENPPPGSNNDAIQQDVENT
jgi:hypothetical protein